MYQTKHCPRCKETKNVELFTKVNEDYYHICKSCRREKYYESKGEIPPKLKPKSLDPSKQICTRCEIEKPLSDFRKGSKKNGTTSRCRLCDTEIIKNRVVEVYFKHEDNKKLCNVCSTIKDVQDFHKNVKSSDGLQSKCKDCMKKYTDTIKNSKIIYEKSCSSCNIVKSRDYFILDKTKSDGLCNICKTCYSDRRKQRRLDPLKKLKDTLRNRIRDSFIKSCNGKFPKSKSTLNIIGCDFKFFHEQIKKQFLNWMDTSNHGFCEESEYNCKYHLDHIIPVSYAKTEEELYLLNHWSNFQPMCGKKNLEKLDTIYPCTNLELGITFWEDRWEYINLD